MVVERYQIWLVVSTHLKHMNVKMGIFPKIGVKKNIWNHHLVICMVILRVCEPVPLQESQDQVDGNLDVQPPLRQQKSSVVSFLISLNQNRLGLEWHTPHPNQKKTNAQPTKADILLVWNHWGGEAENLWDVWCHLKWFATNEKTYQKPGFSCWNTRYKNPPPKPDASGVTILRPGVLGGWASTGGSS